MHRLDADAVLGPSYSRRGLKTARKSRFYIAFLALCAVANSATVDLSEVRQLLDFHDSFTSHEWDGLGGGDA